MIEWISNWAESIIIAVIIATIIEIILPNGNSKKYIKVVIGVYVLFTIVSPVITKFTGETVEVSDILDLDEYIEEAKETAKVQNTIQNNNQSSIMEMYSSGIKDDIKAKIESKGYVVKNIDIQVANDDTYSILGISLDLENKDDTMSNEITEDERKIEPIESVNKIEVNIDNNSNVENEVIDNSNNSNNELSSSEKSELKDYLSSVYEVNKENITIN